MNELPELPKPDVDLCDGNGWAYSDDAMEAYALSAVQMERDKWILREMALADAMGYPGPDASGLSLEEFAAAIRSPSKEG